jgi:uncharacterized protein DUF4129
MRGRATQVVLPALAVLALIAVVAVASTGSTSTGSSESRNPSDTLLDALVTLWIVAAVTGGVLLVYGLMQRDAIAREIASGRYRRTTFLTWLAIAGLFTVFSYWRLSHFQARKPPEDPTVVIGRGPASPDSPASPDVSPHSPEISWLVVAAVVVLVVGAVLAYILSERRSRMRRDLDEDLTEQLALALDDALDDLRAEADPRRAIVAAYARMEGVLAAGGMPRRSAETADEYLTRVLHELAPDSDAVVRLTTLFTQAKFSHHDVDVTMKEEAIEALEEVRDELRTRREERELVGLDREQAATP